jgi:hypothetical protein
MLLMSLDRDDILEVLEYCLGTVGKDVSAHTISKGDHVIFVLPEHTSRESVDEFNETLLRLLPKDSFVVVTHEGKLDLVRFQ